MTSGTRTEAEIAKELQQIETAFRNGVLPEGAYVTARDSLLAELARLSGGEAKQEPRQGAADEGDGQGSSAKAYALSKVVAHLRRAPSHLTAALEPFGTAGLQSLATALLTGAACFVLSLALYRLVFDTRAGLELTDASTHLAFWAVYGISIGCAAILACLAGYLSLLEGLVSLALLLVVYFIPIPAVCALVVPPLLLLKFRHYWHGGGWKYALLGGVLIAVPAQVLLWLVKKVPVGDLLDPHYLVTWPVMAREGVGHVLLGGLFVVFCAVGALQAPSWLRRVGAPLVGIIVAVIVLVMATVVVRPPCEDYADAMLETCELDCSYGRQEYVEKCEMDLRYGDITRGGARRGDPWQCLDWSVRCEEEIEEERKQKLRSDIKSGRGSAVCGHCGPGDVCTAIFQIKKDGRSTPALRATIKDYLNGRGYKRIYGYIVAKVGSGTYEAAWLTGSYWGYVPSSKHFILKTTMTDYSTKGKFNMWARKEGTTSIETTNGFAEDWDIYREDAFGSVIQDIYDAPAGYQTSKAAEEAIYGLCIIAEEL